MNPIETYKLNSKLETESKLEVDVPVRNTNEDVPTSLRSAETLHTLPDNPSKANDKKKTFTSNFEQEKYYRHLNDNIKVRKAMIETVLIWFCGYFFGFLLGFQF